MKISQKLILVCGIPMLAFLLISSLYLRMWWKQADELNEVKKNITVFTSISGLIHEAQKERGLTAIYVGSGDKSGANGQYPLTNKALDALIQSTQGLDLPPTVQAALGSFPNAITHCRNTADSNEKSKAVPAYTSSIATFLKAQTLILGLKDVGFGLQRILTSAQIMEDSKENAGRLRATMSGIVAANKGITPAMLEGMLQLKTGMENGLASNALTLSDHSRAQLKDLLNSKEWTEIKDILRTIVETYSQGAWNMDSKHVFTQVTKVIDRLANISQNELAQCQARIATLHSEARYMVMLLSSVIICAIILISIIVFMVIRSIHHPIAQLMAYAERVAKGDLDSAAPQGMQHELGALCAAWSSVIGTLKKLINESAQTAEKAKDESQKALEAMQDAEAAKEKAERAKDASLQAAAELENIAGAVNAAVESLKQHTVHTGQDADNQAGRLTETSTAMEEMNSTVLEVARSAGQTAEVSAATKERAAHGAQVASQAIASIQGVRDRSLQLKHDMNKLNENARNITNVIAVITEIADQTNLLALNAAIEAARAGEAGRGFAVVADEVRKLAEKTMTSTSEVGHTMSAIQQATNESDKQVDLAVSAIEEATQLVNQSGEALQEIVNLANDTANQMHSIAIAAEEQSATSEEITRSIADVSELSQGVCSSMQEAGDVVHSVNVQTEKLLHLIQQMRQQ